MVGERVGNYQIVERLGEGGMGTVYLATHPELHRRVAVKVLHPDLAQSDEMIQRFFNEARAANAVGHRGIVEVSDLGILPSGAPYIVMELLEGESLAARLTKAGRLAQAAATEIAGQAAGVVGAAHNKGIIHRDLKPDNLFLIPDPHHHGRELLKILDFGIAKLAQRPSPSSRGDLRTRTGAILGTPRYMSPEQCRETRDVDHRTDVYSLGVVLYEMLSGTPPFTSDSWLELAFMHVGVSPPALQTRAPDVSDRVARIVHRALEKDPGARFQSMAEFKEVLEAADGPRTRVLPTASPSGPGSTVRFEGTTPGRATHPTTLAGAASEILSIPATPPKRGVPVMLALAVAAAGAAIAIASVMTVRQGPAPVPVPVPVAAPMPAAPAATSPAPSAPAPVTTTTSANEVEGSEDARPDRDQGTTANHEVIPKPGRSKPAQRRRPPAKAAPPTQAAPRAQEPLKI